ncbi:MAG: hypothetical protein ACXW2E_02085 [Nitrososphaeraceae archaeon]
MILNEVMYIGDNNAIGGLIDTVIKNLNLIKNKKETKSIVNDLIKIIQNLDYPSIIMNDGFSLIKYLTILTDKNISKNRLQMVLDTLLTFNNDAE